MMALLGYLQKNCTLMVLKNGKGEEMKLSQADTLLNILSTMLETKGIVGFKIARNYRMIEDELKEYIQKKQELFMKYGNEVEGKLIIEKDSENYPLFLQEIKPYEEQEVEFNFRKITEEELAQSELTAAQMLLLGEMVEGE